jgi:hypothetical protein
MAYMPLILASTAGAMEMEAAIFFTFYGLQIIHKKNNKNLKVPPLANPAMPMPVPNIVGVLPGMTAMATMMMKSWWPAGPDSTCRDVQDSGSAHRLPDEMAMGIRRNSSTAASSRARGPSSATPPRRCSRSRADGTPAAAPARGGRVSLPPGPAGGT